MRNALERLTFLAPARYLNPLAQLFFFITLGNGVAFTFFANSASVSMSILYTSTVTNVGAAALPIWGVLMIVVAVLNTVALATRTFSMGRTAAFLGCLGWLYAATLYTIGAAWFQLIVYVMPNLVFWIWYYFAVSKYDDAKSGWLIKRHHESS